jgi:hypothetical protein
MIRASIAIVFLALLTPMAPAAEPVPDFSGYWQLDRAKSAVAPSTEMAWLRVEHAGATVVATLRVFPKGQAEEGQTFVYTIGATGGTNTMHGAPMTSDVSWDAATLDIRSVAMFGNDPLKLHDRWTLSADGAVLTLREVSQNKDDPERLSVFVMNRRGEQDWPPDHSSEPAETQYRNIQALKGLPASQLPAVMRSFARGLGVQCAHCHVAGHFDLDEKPAKRTARKMLELTTRWNAEAPPPLTAVSCWTCHRGALKPE